MKKLKVDLSSAMFKEEITDFKEDVKKNHYLLHNKEGAGSDFLGWIDLPDNYDTEEFEQIKKYSQKVQNDSEILIVIGIGGSYLGTRAVIDALTNTFNNQMCKKKRKKPMVIYAGNNISSKYLTDLLQLIEGRDISINVISKSGTTTEPAIAFRVLKEYIENKYGKEEARNRIYVTTDKNKGALRTLADKEGYQTFVVPDDIGGRYSVLTAVGLFPIAVAGIDIDKLMLGAKAAKEEYSNENLEENECYKYAVARNILYNNQKDIEILVNYEPTLMYFTEWWKQLYGESEGKENKGLFPAGVQFTTDLHSMGQYIQDGKRNIFETVINIEEVENDLIIKSEADDLDGLNYLSGKTVDYVNKKAMEGTKLAHLKGDVPNIVINIEKLDEYNLGKLIYFFEKACAMSGYILGVNPFDQPGVEEYKTNMFKLLEKPGYTQD